MDWIQYERRIKKVLVCPQCIFRFAFLMFLVSVFVISAWQFLTGH
jgi:hypothetical protein